MSFVEDRGKDREKGKKQVEVKSRQDPLTRKYYFTFYTFGDFEELKMSNNAGYCLPVFDS